jgi:hypothetical protein
MTMIVNGPDGLSVNFPDGTDKDTINRVMGEAHLKHQAQARIKAEGESHPVLQAIDNRVRAVARGVPLVGGAADEISAGLNTGFGLIGDYPKELAYQRERDAQFDSSNPIESGVEKFGGGVAGTLAGARGLGLGVPETLAGKITTGAATGAGLGAAQGFTEGEGGVENRLARAKSDATTGIVLGLGAPILGTGIGKVAGALLPKVPLPSTQSFKDLAESGYKQAESANLQFAQKPYADTLDQISTALQQRGHGGILSEITDSLFPKSAKIAGALEKTRGASPMLTDVELAKRAAAGAADGVDADASASGVIAKKLRAMIDNAQPGDFVSGNVDTGLEGIGQGRTNWAKFSKAKILDDANERALNTAGANYTQAGHATALQQEYKKIANAPDFKTQWTPEEQDAILAVVRPSKTALAMKAAGRAAPGGGGLSTMFNLGMAATNPSLAFPVMGAATAAKSISSKAVTDATRIVEELVKTGQVSSGASSKASAIQKIATQLLIGQTGNSSEALRSPAPMPAFSR